MIAPDSRFFTLLLASLTMITALAIDMSLPAMPALTVALHSTPDRVQLTLSLFFLGFGLGQLVYGPLSDRFGRRPVLLSGLVIYTVAGFACALASNVETLILARLAQGIGCCAGPVMSRAVVRDHFSGSRAAQMLSAITMVVAVGPLLAPIIGGALLVNFGWPAIFLCLGGCGLVITLASWWSFGESLKQPDRQALQPARMLANYRAFLGSPASLGFGFVNAFTFAGVFGFISGSPFVLIETYHVPSDHYWFYFSPLAVALIAGAFTNNRLVRHMPGERVLRRGLTLMLVASAVLLTVSWTRWGGAAGLMLPVTLYTFSQTLVFPNATVAAMERLPHMAGTASAILGALQMAGAGISGYAVNALYDGTPVAMGSVLAVMAILSFATYHLWVRRAERRRRAA